MRYLIPNATSEYLVAIPRKPEIHIQKIAPGPPAAIAVATPAMFPTPTVPPSAMFNAANGVNAMYNAPRETYGLARPKMSQFIK